MAKAALETTVTPLCEKQAAEMGLELVEVALDKESGGRYLRIYLDKDTGLTLDDCEKYHRAIQPKLEDYDYDFLEVSSPGLDRPLKKPADYERHTGDEVEVHLYRPLDGCKVFTGILMGLEDDTVRLEIGDTVREFPLKSLSLVKPIIDMTGIDEVEL